MRRDGSDSARRRAQAASQVRVSLTLSFLAAAWLATAVPGVSTTYTAISDSDLAAQASVIVQATVLASEPAPTPSPPSTDTFVQVERVLKGYVAGSTVVIRVLGGIGPEGEGLEVWGTPDFHDEDRVLLFLKPRSDGTYTILHLMLGVFHEVEVGNRRLALRNLLGTTEVGPGGEIPTWMSDRKAEPIRDFEKFAAWLAEVGSGSVATSSGGAADYQVRPQELPDFTPGEAEARVEERCTGLGFRWFEFDRGRRVKWGIDSRGFAGPGSGSAEFGRARSVWRQASRSHIRLSSSGDTPSRRGFAAPDGVNALLFNDPGEWIPGRYDCYSGGILAVSGVWFESGTDQDCQVVGAGEKGRYGGRTYLRIRGADIVTNDGSACYLAAGSEVAAEVFAHELGHSLGLAHSREGDALMRSRGHEGARGPMPAPGDSRALERLYLPRE